MSRTDELQIIGVPVKAGADITVSVYRHGDEVLLIVDLADRGEGVMATLGAAGAAYVAGLLAAGAGVERTRASTSSAEPNRDEAGT